MKKNQFNRLLDLLERLDQDRVPYTLRRSRDDALMIVAHAPGEYWEIELLADGDVEIERYWSKGEIEGESTLKKLFALWSDDEPAPRRMPKDNDAVARR